MLDLGQMGQTFDNLIRTRESAINLPSEDLVKYIDRLALTTGKNPAPEKKRQWGYRYEPDKFGGAGSPPSGRNRLLHRVSAATGSGAVKRSGGRTEDRRGCLAGRHGNGRVVNRRKDSVNRLFGSFFRSSEDHRIRG